MSSEISKIEQLISDAETYEATIEQRLRWQAANQELQAVLPSQKEHKEGLIKCIRQHQENYQAALEKIGMVLNYEKIYQPNSAEGTAIDSSALDVIGQCVDLTLAKINFDDVDVKLGAFLDEDPENRIDNFLYHLESNLANAEKQILKRQESLEAGKKRVKSLIFRQGKLFDNVREQLKKLHHADDSVESSQNIENKFKSVSKEMVSFDGDAAENQLEEWQEKLEYVYDMLENLSKDLEKVMETQETEEKSFTPKEGLSNQFGSGSRPMTPLLGKVKSVGGANVQAMKVWKVVERKLKKQNIDEQVESLIEEAKSKKNLCKLFEGWTSWV